MQALLNVKTGKYLFLPDDMIAAAVAGVDIAGISLVDGNLSIEQGDFTAVLAVNSITGKVTLVESEAGSPPTPYSIWEFDPAASSLNLNASVVQINGSTVFQSANQTIDLLTTDTTAQKQAKIDAVPKCCRAGTFPTVTFRFEDGTHTEADTLEFHGFQFPILVEGNASDASSLSTAQSVTIDGGGHSSHVLSFQGCADATISKLKVLSSDVANIAALYGYRNSAISLQYSYLVVAGQTANSNGVRLDTRGFFYIQNTYFEDGKYSVVCIRTTTSSNNNDSTVTDAAYGLYASACDIKKGGANQPSGTTANEATAGGGVIE